jgi:hypothetical protein
VQIRILKKSHAVEPVPESDSLDYNKETTMPQQATVTRAQLIDKLNEDLSREYQAIIAYVVYSQVLKGAKSCSMR